MSDAPVISVRGEVVLEAQPELALLSVHVQSQEDERRTALDRLVERNQHALDLIRSYGAAVERVETGGLAISPVLRQRRREGEIRAYQGTAWIKVTVVDFTVLGELVTRLGDMERTFVHGPQWDLRRDSEVYARAARQAAQEAVARARSYAEALGARLTGLVELADSGLIRDNVRAATPMMAAPMAAETYGAVPPSEPEPIVLEPETQLVRSSVEARFTVTAPDLDG
ncbi:MULTISPECIES: SIMPL domain-containing protein [Actinomadura]